MTASPPALDLTAAMPARPESRDAGPGGGEPEGGGSPPASILNRHPLLRTVPADVLLLAPVLALLYGHAIWMLAHGFWRTEDGFYSPFLLVLAAWLAWREMQGAGRVAAPARIGVAILAAGLVFFLLGRLVGNISLELGSSQIVVPGLIVALAGWRAVRRHLWALGTVAVAVPLPGSAVVALTFPLKMAAATVAAAILRLLGLPVARQGVMIDIGDYRLMVVDACSGLQSMYSLIAAVFLYLALTGERSRRGTIVLLVAILPIAFVANVLRVVMLALVTFAWGDAAGQGFLHGFAGVMMFAAALIFIIALDHPRGPAR